MSDAMTYQCRCIRIYPQQPTRIESERAKQKRIDLDRAVDAGWRAMLAYYCHPIDTRDRP